MPIKPQDTENEEKGKSFSAENYTPEKAKKSSKEKTHCA